ncbi:hypothetical protein RyT2_18680 [Pseudolactococcus yaeyamensis]
MNLMMTNQKLNKLIFPHYAERDIKGLYCGEEKNWELNDFGYMLALQTGKHDDLP